MEFRFILKERKQKKVSQKAIHRIFGTLLSFSTVSVDHNGNDTRLLSPDAESTSCLASCERASDLGSNKILAIAQEYWTKLAIKLSIKALLYATSPIHPNILVWGIAGKKEPKMLPCGELQAKNNPKCFCVGDCRRKGTQNASLWGIAGEKKPQNAFVWGIVGEKQPKMLPCRGL